MTNRSLDVLLVTEDFPPMPGGVAKYLSELCKFSNLRIGVLAIDTSTNPVSDCGLPCRIERISLPKFVGMIVLTYTLLRRVIRGKPSVVVWGDYSSGMLATAILSPIAGFRTGVIVHGTRLNMGLTGPLFGRLLARFNLRACACVICNSVHTRNRLAAYGIRPDRLHVLHPGVDTARFRPGGVPAFLMGGFSLDGKRVISTVGRLVKKKNHSLVMDAVAALSRKYPELVYLVCGDGEWSEELREYARSRDIWGRVVFLGNLSGRDLEAVYAVSEIMVLPSRVETFGMAFIEAGACGKPVIGSRTGGIPESVADGETGFLVYPDDLLELTEKIDLLLSDRDLARHMGRNGRARVEKMFDSRMISGQFDKLMRKTADA